MKVGIGQINTTVGDLAGNAEIILKAYRELCTRGADLVVFPELAIAGYPPRDLVFKSRFARDNRSALEELAEKIGDVPALIGFVDSNTAEMGRRAFNAAAWCEKGAIRHVAHKCLLPSYDVFDEDRYFESGQGPLVVSWKSQRIGITICEDIWTGPIVETSRHYSKDPVRELASAGVDLVLNLSASPWHLGKGAFRRRLIGECAKITSAPCVYCNAIGGNDELIFDGHSMVVSASGELIAGLPGFEEDLAVVDVTDASAPYIAPDFDQGELADIHDALVLGLRDYAHKSGFRKAVLGLSGGIDSALVAAIAVEALGKENVLGVSLPSEISSQHSRDDAESLARNLGIEYKTLPISSLVDAAMTTLAPIFSGMEADVAEENIQARSRGLLLMALSNKFGALLLTTGNKSELAVGYCTLYGDMAGGLAVISDLPKTKVYALSHWINRHREIIPNNTIVKPPSAELRPGQVDQDSLPPYDVLDEVLRLYVEEGMSRAEIIDRGFDSAMVKDVARKVDLNEYKRKQAAPGLKITPLAFGVGRRIPIVQRYVS